MKKLDKILNKKRVELESKEKLLQKRIEVKRLKSEAIKKTSEEELQRKFEIKEADKLRQKELERKYKKKKIIKAANENAFSYGLVGLIVGAVLGMGKGCVNYGNSPITSTGYKSFSALFRFIIPDALITCFIGIIIGIIVGVSKGENY